MFGLCIASLILFAGLSFILARDDGPFGTAIRLGEILIPLASAMVLSGLYLKGEGRNYFIASCFFGLAFAFALLRKSPSFWNSKAPEGGRVFIYAVMVFLGCAIAAVTYFGNVQSW